MSAHPKPQLVAISLEFVQRWIESRELAKEAGVDAEVLDDLSLLLPVEAMVGAQPTGAEGPAA